MRSGGAAHKNMEAPQSIDNGDARRWYLVTSHWSLLIPSHLSLKVQRVQWVQVAASPRTYGAMPESLLGSGFPVWVSCHRLPERE